MSTFGALGNRFEERFQERGLYREYEAMLRRCHRYQMREVPNQPGPAVMTMSLGGHELRSPPLASAVPGSFTAPLEEYYPTHRKFMWHHTASYWTAVLFVQGSLLFSYNAAVGVFHKELDWRPETRAVMQKWPNFFGGIMFMTGAYCSYLNLINMKKEPGEPIEYFLANWQKVRQNHSEVSSRVGTMAYFFGANIFQIGCIFAFFELQPIAQYVLVAVPNTVGSMCFVLGGICEVVHNGVFHPCHDGSTPCDLVWWVAILNTIGGINFLLGSSPGILKFKGESANYFCELNYLIGSVIFLAASWFTLLMWRANGFGLALIKQLNEAITAGSARVAQRRGQHTIEVDLHPDRHAEAAEDGAENTFSLRGATFIGLYCWLSCVAILNVLCDYLWATHSLRMHGMRYLSQVCTQVLVAAGAMLVLALHSTVTSVPKEEPYRAVVIISRAVLLFGAIAETISFFDFLLVPYDSPGPPVGSSFFMDFAKVTDEHLRALAS